MTIVEECVVLIYKYYGYIYIGKESEDDALKTSDKINEIWDKLTEETKNSLIIICKNLQKGLDAKYFA